MRTSCRKGLNVILLLEEYYELLGMHYIEEFHTEESHITNPIKL
jgi:hypothetical protein